MCVHVCLYVYMYAYVYVYVYVCMHMCMYVCVYRYHMLSIGHVCLSSIHPLPNTNPVCTLLPQTL